MGQVGCSGPDGDFGVTTHLEVGAPVIQRGVGEVQVRPLMRDLVVDLPAVHDMPLPVALGKLRYLDKHRERVYCQYIQKYVH